MSHYEEQYEQYYEALRKKRQEADKIPLPGKLGDRMWEIYENNKSVKTAKKERQGKPEGARFCFFSSIALLSRHWADTTIDYVCMYFDDLVYMSPSDDSQAYLDKIHDIIEMIENSVDDVSTLYNEVVEVRYNPIVSGKYSADNHKKDIDPTLLLDAIARHLIAYMFVDPIDPESNKSHLAHVIANLAMLVQQFRS